MPLDNLTTNETFLTEYPFRTESKLFFNTYSEPLVGKYKDGNTDQIGIWRDDETNSFLGNHTEKYEIVNNQPLIKGIEAQIIKSVSNSLFTLGTRTISNVLDNVEVNDFMSFNGKVCIAEYKFNKLAESVGTLNPSDVLFRLIILNSFDGSKPITVYGGTIDTFCTNGLITGQFTTTSQRHTGDFNDKGHKKIKNGIENMFKNYSKELERYHRWAKTPLNDNVVNDFLTNQFVKSEIVKEVNDGIERDVIHETVGMNKRKDLFNIWESERDRRGANLWALTSALTYYSSSGDYGTRSSDNDHEHATRLKQQNEMSNVLNSREFIKLEQRIAA